MTGEDPSSFAPRSTWLTRLALVGAGAVGSEVARQLALAGYRHVLLIDSDTIEPHNLATSTLYAELDAARRVVNPVMQPAERDESQAVLGAAKVRVLAGYAARVHGLTWTPVEREIADVGLGTLRDRDLILSCTDSALARVETAFAARTLRVPMLDAAVRNEQRPEGRLTFFAAAPDAACYLCGFTAARRAEILAYALSASLGCTLAPEAVMSGTAASASAVAAALVAAIPATAGANTQSFAQILRESEARESEAHGETIFLPASAACPWHPLPSLNTMTILEEGQTFAAALSPLGADAVLDLPWPMCLRARCRSCGVGSTPFARAAFTRRRGVCPACGATGTLDPLECVASLRAGEPAASLTPRQLGLPVSQLYHRRRAFRADDCHDEHLPAAIKAND